MKLINYKGIKGFYIEDLKRNLSKEKYRDFEEFLRFQTVALINNKELVYLYDFKRWCGRTYNLRWFNDEDIIKIRKLVDVDV